MKKCDLFRSLVGLMAYAHLNNLAPTCNKARRALLYIEEGYFEFCGDSFRVLPLASIVLSDGTTIYASWFGLKCLPLAVPLFTSKGVLRKAANDDDEQGGTDRKLKSRPDPDE